MTAQQSIEKLERQKAEIEKMKKTERSSPAFEKWSRDTKICIEKIFGEQNSCIGEFEHIHYISMTMGASDSEDHAEYLKGLDKTEALLESMISQIKDYGINQVENNGTSFRKKCPVSIVENICNRFHLVVQQLKDRHGNRKTLNVNDEYDVQDLLQTLLRFHFDDVRPEEVTPSYAGSGSRMDFLLKDEQIVIETKKTRDGLGAKELKEQLIIDIENYKEHHNCKLLICFVYDPGELIKNPSAIEKDIGRRKRDGLEVEVMIRSR